jgi:predicted N-acetyltransferase YhbS
MAEPMLIPPDPDQHLMAISKITSDAFAGGEYVDEISQQYIGSCNYDWDTSRLIFDGEQLIHHWGVWGYPMRLGSVQVKVAGIGAVFTEEEYRKQGMMQMAAEDSIKAMQENGYDLSILRGRHYVKFGYARAWNYVTYRLEPEEIPDLSPKLPYEMLAPDKMDQINTIYNQFHRDFSGTTVRPTYRMLEAEDMRAYGWLDEQGNLASYARAVPTEDKKTLQCLEAAGDPQQGLAVLAAIFKAGEYETATSTTPAGVCG